MCALHKNRHIHTLIKHRWLSSENHTCIHVHVTALHVFFCFLLLSFVFFYYFVLYISIWYRARWANLICKFLRWKFHRHFTVILWHITAKKHRPRWFLAKHRCFLPSLAPFGQAVSEEKIFLTVANQKQEWYFNWNHLLRK
jgi:hypothetical protein